MTAKKKKQQEDKMPWGRSIPYTSPTGKQTTLYNIGTVAAAIGRTAQTIRRWEVAGIIPPTPFKQGNRRLYSQEHLDSLVRNAEKYRVTMGIRISKAFTKRLIKEFQEINDYFFKEEN